MSACTLPDSGHDRPWRSALTWVDRPAAGCDHSPRPAADDFFRGVSSARLPECCTNRRTRLLGETPMIDVRARGDGSREWSHRFQGLFLSDWQQGIRPLGWIDRFSSLAGLDRVLRLCVLYRLLLLNRFQPLGTIDLFDHVVEDGQGETGPLVEVLAIDAGWTLGTSTQRSGT